MIASRPVTDHLSSPVFVEHAGGAVVSRRILDGTSGIKWLLREEPAHPADSGWRFLSAIDDDAYADDPANMVTLDFTTVAAIEPAVFSIYHLPVGSDLQLVVENGGRHFLDNITGQEITHLQETEQHAPSQHDPDEQDSPA
ncbi:DUF2185 domain-containing protein [Sanguibacter sp. 25GB23B1]|uniref:immunity protein Imm33 domain-containing protein n=1 Tax=unclassified Sanguibacter TaxID=2645534 RepID=UPI0032AFAACF